ncbi:MAG: tetratricopeptide repeat protein [Proteobacteria bacterium]|nr:tetratricopeptide repeat protein [Pseudomonadota bacterium]
MMIMVLVAAVGMTACVTAKSSQNYEMGLTALKQKQYERAHQLALAAYAETPGDPGVMSLLGWTYFKNGQTDQALPLFQSAYERNSQEINAIQGLAWTEYTMGRGAESKSWFEKQWAWADKLRSDKAFKQFKPEDQRFILSVASDVQYGLGLLAKAAGDQKGASAYFQKALETPNDFTGHQPIRAAIADAYYYSGQYKEAAKEYRSILAEGEDDALQLRLGWSYQLSGDYVQAEKAFRQGKDRARDSRPFLYGLVFATYAQDKKNEAKSALTDLIAIDPYSADTADISALIEKTPGWMSLGRNFALSYFKWADYGQTLRTLGWYLPTAEQDCPSRLLGAWSNLYYGYVQAALDQFEALASGGRCRADEMLLNQGDALIYLGRLDEAEKAFAKANKSNSRNGAALAGLGSVAYYREDYPEAIKRYQDCLSLLPAREQTFSWPSVALYNLGWSYIRTGRYQEALTTFEKLKGYHPKPIYASVFSGLGWSYLHLNRTEEAKRAFDEALALNPYDYSAQSGMATVSFAGRGQ